MSADIKNVVKAMEDDINQLPNVSSESEVTKEQALARIQKEVSIVNAVEKRVFDEKLQRDEYELKKDHTYAQDEREKDRFNLEKDRFNHEKECDERNNELNKDKLKFDKDVHSDSNKLDQQRVDLEKEKIKNNNTLEKDKLQLEKDRFKEEKIQNEIKKNIAQNNYDLEKLKLEYEKDRVKFEQENVKIQNDIRRDNMKFQLISLGVTAGLGLLGFIANMIGLAVSDRAHKRVMTMIYLDEGRSTTELKDSVKRLDNFIKKY